MCRLSCIFFRHPIHHQLCIATGKALLFLLVSYLFSDPYLTLILTLYAKQEKDTAGNEGKRKLRYCLNYEGARGMREKGKK